MDRATAKIFLGAAILLLPQMFSATTYAQAASATLPDAPIPQAQAASSPL